MLAQFDTPDRILAHPASEFVRRFIGRPNLKRLGMIQVGQLPRHDVPLLDEALTPIASTHPPLASPLRLVLDRQRRPLHWFDPQRGLTLPVERPLASSHSLRLPTTRCSTWRPACWCMWMTKANTGGGIPHPAAAGARRRGGGAIS